MKKLFIALVILLPVAAQAQYKDTVGVQKKDSTLVLTLDDAIKIALSENTSVKVADMEVKRQDYAKKGSYGALFPQINATASFQHTIKKQRMYMGGNSGGSGSSMASMMGSALEPINYYIGEFLKRHPDIQPYVAPTPEDSGSSGKDGGIEVGRKNTWNAGINATMPIVNVQLWESLKLSGEQVELAVEQARESRLNTLTKVKQAYYTVLLAKASYDVYLAVMDNAIQNLKLTQSKYNVNRATELDLARAQSSVAAAVPNVFNAEASISLSLWQLKAIMGLDLDMDIDVAGSLEDYAQHMLYDITEGVDASIDRNTQLKQLAIQTEMLASQVRMQKDACLPTLSLNFAYSYNAMAEDFVFRNYQWTPYSYVGLSLNIPIFAGGSRHHSIKQVKLQAQELDLQRTETERQVKISIRQQLSTMDTAMKSYEAAKEAFGSAEKAYNIATRSFEIGKSTLTDLNNTELTLTQTKIQTLQAVYDFLNAKSALEQTLGYDYTTEI